jgi:hypothetical protein
MRILFDQGTPVPLRRHLHPHLIDTSAERGWSGLQNGDLLREAEANDYDALATTDQSLKYQQNLGGRAIRIVVLTSTSWPRIGRKIQQIRDALDMLQRGGYVEVEI